MESTFAVSRRTRFELHLTNVFWRVVSAKTKNCSSVFPSFRVSSHVICKMTALMGKMAFLHPSLKRQRRFRAHRSDSLNKGYGALTRFEVAGKGGLTQQVLIAKLKGTGKVADAKLDEAENVLDTKLGKPKGALTRTCPILTSCAG